MINTRNEFFNANGAFNYFWVEIHRKGVNFDNTKALFNIGFTIHHPMDNEIKSEIRKWNKAYADAEWEWYLSGNRSIDKLGEIYGKIPPIWERMADDNREVNSNYGWQWLRGNQMQNVIDILHSNPNSRQASISIYDGKEWDQYEHDTPCTYAIHFYITDNVLNMSVLMRSNDLWYGFCNDQYCFSMLHKYVADKLSIKTGIYYHYAQNLHIYNDKLNKSARLK